MSFNKKNCYIVILLIIFVSLRSKFLGGDPTGTGHGGESIYGDTFRVFLLLCFTIIIYYSPLFSCSIF